MSELLLSFAPFFVLVMLGWAAARTGVLPLPTLPGLNTFVLYFALPCMLFRLAAQGALLQGLVPGLLLVYGLAGAAVVTLVLWTGRHLPRKGNGLLALATAFPNTGFLGLPLLTGLLGDVAAGTLAATLIIDVIVLSTVCLAWAHSRPAPVQGLPRSANESHETDDGLQAALAVLRGALRNPMLWGMALGSAWHATGWALPSPVARTVNLLALSASPVALFSLGAMLWRAQWHHRQAHAGRFEGGVGARTLPLPLPVLAGLKLMVHPALVLGLGALLGVAGVPVPPEGLVALVLAAALPSASNVSMLAERERANPDAVARLILWTTAASVLSLALWAHGLGVRSPH